MRNTFISGFVYTFLIFASVTLQASDTGLKYQGIAHDSLFDLCFYKEHGFAVGQNGLVLESSDGGQHWQKNTGLTTKSALLGVDCLNDKYVAVGQEGSLFLYQKSQWSDIDTGTDQRLFSVTLNEEGLGFAVGGFGTIIKTIDGGKNWQTLQPNWELLLNDFVEPHLYDVSIGENGMVTIVGEFEIVLRSTDMGESWKIVHKGDSSLFSLHFSDASLGYAVGQNGRVIKTQNGGESWEPIETNNTSNLLSVLALPTGEVLITGIRTLLVSTDGARSWSQVNYSDVSVGWYNGIAMTDKKLTERNSTQGNVYAVGHMARIIELTNQVKK